MEEKNEKDNDREEFIIKILGENAQEALKIIEGYKYKGEESRVEGEDR